MSEQYTKQLEETIATQSEHIAELRTANSELVEKYNNLVKNYNEVVDMMRACGVKETKLDSGGHAWAVTMQVGEVSNPQELLKEKGVDVSIDARAVTEAGDSLLWQE